MAGWNADRSDTVRMLREQASRVYIQTIAANEREDRILHRKLDALDLEHRAQFLKMKKWIQDARVNRKKRLMKLRSNVSYASEPVDNTKKLSNDRVVKDRISKQEPTTEENPVNSKQTLPSPPVLENDIEAIEEVMANKRTRRGLSSLKHRVKYTESEVAHLKASFAGQRTPPNVRRRTFLPHLQELSPAPISSGKRKRRVRRKGKEKSMQIVGEKLTQLSLEASKISDEKLPSIHADNGKTRTNTSI